MHSFSSPDGEMTKPNQGDLSHKNTCSMNHKGSRKNSRINLSPQDKFKTQSDDFERALSNMKLKHMEKLSRLKMRNITEEQSLCRSNNLEYRNTIWEISLKYLGHGLFSEDLQSVFEQALNEEQFRLEKEYIELERRYEEERAHTFTRSIRADSSRHRVSKKNVPEIIPPKELALIIFNRMQAANQENDLLDQKAGGEANKDMAKCVRKGNRKVMHESTNYKNQVTERLQKQKKESPNKKIPSTLKRHVQARHRLQKYVAQTDRFVRQIKERQRYECSSPCFG